VFTTPVVSPDGRWLAAARSSAAPALYPVDASASRVLPGSQVDDTPLRWTADGGSLFVRRGNGIPASVERIEVATGKRQHWKELQPADSAGVFGITSIVVTPDGTSYAFTFSSSLGSLYLAEGIK